MANTNIVRLAKEFVLKVGNMVIARCTDYTLTIGANIIDVTSFDSDDWEEALSGHKNFSISFSSMVTRDGTATEPYGQTGLGSGTFDNLFDQMANDNYPFTVALGTQGTGSASGHTYSGNGVFESIEMSGNVGDKIVYNGRIKGAGKLSRV